MDLIKTKKFFDPRWRLNNLYKIRTKDKKLKTFQENEIQKYINDNRTGRDIILKSRQVGVSTNEILRKFDLTIWNKHTTFCILAHEQDALKKLFTIVRRAYENMDPRYKQRLGRGGGSKYEMYFPDLDSKVYVDLESRGDTINLLHASEYAFMADPDKFQATVEAVPLNGGEVSIETTPNGINHFYDLYMDLKGNYKKFFFPWFVNNEYQIPDCPIPESSWTNEEKAFAEKVLAKYGVTITPAQIAFRRFKQSSNKLFIQEYPEDDITCFLTSGKPYFDLLVVQKRYNELGPALEEREDGLTIFKQPDPNKTYVIGADTAEGDGDDFCVGEVWCVEDFEQVAELRGKWKPSDFAQRLFDVGKIYAYQKRGITTYPLLGVERNNHGHAVLQYLDEVLEYPNLYFQRGRKKEAEMKRGWATTTVSRPIMLSAFQTLVDDDTDAINSKVTLSECLSFVNKDGKPQHAEGKHDDTVIANAIALQMMIKDSTGFEFIKIGANGAMGNQSIDHDRIRKYLQT